MRMKNLLLASTALALLGGAQQAQADMYVSVFGGANWLEDSSIVNVTGPYSATVVNTDADTGFVLGGAVGARLDNWLKGLRAEVEASYRRQDVGGFWGYASYFTSFTGAVDANQSTFAILANVWYDIDVGWKVKPYVGGGIGWGRAKADGVLVSTAGYSPTTTFNVEQSGFAWQLGLGFNYEVADGVDVGLGYRYFQGPELDVFFFGKGAVSKIENDNHSVMVNLSVDIN